MEIKIFDYTTYKSLGSLKEVYVKSCFPLNSYVNFKNKDYQWNLREYNNPSENDEMIVIGFKSFISPISSNNNIKDKIVIVKVSTHDNVIWECHPDDIKLSIRWLRDKKLESILEKN
jgi:hypothetical protein